MERTKWKIILTVYLTTIFVVGIFLSPQILIAQVTEEWVARYNGQESGEDFATAIGIDSAGNVYVTGSTNWSNGSDYGTIKYDANGNQLWLVRYNNGVYNDHASALAVDAVGNVYVTGDSDGLGTVRDYATIKYDTNGNQLWVARYDGPDPYVTNSDYASAIAVDAAGNVYVTGLSFGGWGTTFFDYATIKYDSNGNQLWVARYNGPLNSNDSAVDLAIDQMGNVYVTGISYQGGIGTSDDYVTIKYDTNGNELWVARYNGLANGQDIANAIAVDSSGNVYVTGKSDGIGSDKDYATVKYDTNGNQLYEARYNGSGNGFDWPTDLAVDVSGNVYVTGESQKSSGAFEEYATIKYDSVGNQLWAAHYDGPINWTGYAAALAVDANSSVYVTGDTGGSGTYADYDTVKYDTNGNEIWVARYNGPGNAPDDAVALTVDTTGNVYVTGNSMRVLNGDRDYITIKYSQAPAAEICDGIDNDGDGFIDEGFPNTDGDTQADCVDPDDDNDGYSDAAEIAAGSDPLNAASTPEVCDAVDNDLDGQTDEGFLQDTYYQDADNDTYGNASVTIQACTQPSGYVTNSSDCDDGNALINPGAAEVCNGVDDNCNGLVDNDPFYADADGDGYGDPAYLMQACTQPSGYVTDNTDCNDGNALVYPGASEIPNDGIDQDCSGSDLAVETRIDGGFFGDQRFPWADYNEATSEYLVLWQDKRNGASDDIYGVRLDQNGNRIGSDFPVSTAAGHQQRVLVKAGGGGYLALWHDLRNQATNGADIYGVWVAGDGTVGPEMAICACAQDQWNAVAGYDPVTNTFLVVWLDARGSVNNQGSNPNDDFDLYGVVIPAGGSLSLTPFTVVSANNGQRGPQIGYDYGNGQYYLAWNDRRSGTDYDIYGARLTTSGVSLDGTGVLLSGASGNQFRPTVTDRRPAEGIANHLIAWSDYRSGSQGDVYGVYVDGSGAVVSPGEFAISTDAADEANVVADVDWINTKKNMVSWIRQQTPATYYNVVTGEVDQGGGVTGGSVLNPVADEQRANALTYATDGLNDYGFLEVSADRRNGTDYDIWGIKVWP